MVTEHCRRSMQTRFYELALRCRSFIGIETVWRLPFASTNVSWTGCRLSPHQKAHMVKHLRYVCKRTVAAIGDGGSLYTSK